MGWKILGWFVFVIGLGGLIADVIFLVHAVQHQGFPPGLAVNCFVCLMLIWGGWALAHRKTRVAPTPT